MKVDFSILYKTGMIFLKLFIKLISALFQWIKKSDKIDLLEKRCRWFQLFSVDFQLFYFLIRIIPDMTDYSEYYIVTRTIIVCWNKYTLKPVYKGHSREPENVAFMSTCPLYTG